MSDSKVQLHTRRLTGVSAAAERRILIKIAGHLPGFVTPNILTVLGLFGGLLTGLGYVLSGSSRWWLAVAVLGYAVHWFGDSLDGTLARVRGIERPRFGMFIDQSADLLTVALILGGLALSPWVDLAVGMGVYIGYLLLAVIVHVRAAVTGVYDIAHGGIGPTEGRIIMVIFTALMAIFPPETLTYRQGLTDFDFFLIGMAVWSIITCCREVYRVSRQLALEEPYRRTPA